MIWVKSHLSRLTLSCVDSLAVELCCVVLSAAIDTKKTK
jgi:hypothetical protein